MKRTPAVRKISQRLLLRTLVEADAPVLALLANDRSVWENLRDAIPLPYGIDDALHYIHQCAKEQPPLSFGIFCDGVLTGMVGLVPGRDVNRITGEVGYWVGTPHRGQGTATAALAEMMRYALQEFGFYKLTAGVFAGNGASVRVLQKCGFTQEAVLKGHALKNGTIMDEWRFAYINRILCPNGLVYSTRHKAGKKQRMRFA